MSSRSSSSSSDLLGPSGDNDYLLSSPTKPSTGRQQRFMSPTNFKLLQTPGSVKGKGQRMGSPAKSAHSVRFDDVLLPASPAARKLNGGRQRSLSPEKGELDGSSSPWRIRVTLEATQDEDEENQSSNPLRKMFGPSTTMTTKVPLKDERDQTEATPRRRRGRPRKTDIQPSPAKSTPTPTASPGHTPGAKGTSGQSKRGRPRKNVLSSTEQQVNERSSPILEQPTPVPKQSSVPEQPTPVPEQPTPLPEQSPPTPFPEPTPSLETEQEPYSPLNLGADGDSEDDDLPGDMPDDFFPVEQRHEREQSDTNWNRSSPRVTFDTPDVSTIDRDYDDTKLNSTPSRMPSSSRQPITSSPANTIHAGRTPRPPPRLYPTPTSSSLVGEEDQEPDNVTNQEEPMSEPYQTQEQPMNDPTNEHREFDSMVESEGFSMVSLDTLPSAKQHEVGNKSERVKGPLKPFFEREAIRTTEKPTKRKASSLSNTYYDDSPNTETQMDPEPTEEPPRKRQTRSPVDHQKRQEQPSSSSRPFEQSMLLSPPGEVTAPTPADNRRRPFSRLARIIRAGVALEGTLRQNHGPDTWPDENYDFDTPKKRLEHVFSDLDSDTQKELRAGLGLGREIAMRKIQAETERAEREEAEQEEAARVAAEQQELARRQAHEERERAKREERAKRAADQERARKKAQTDRERAEQEEAAREAAEEAAEQERARRFQAEIERAEQEEAAAREAAEQERIRRRAQAERQRVEQEEYAARVAAEEAAEEAAHAAEQERVRRKFQAEIERAEHEEAVARQAAEQEHMRRRAQTERQRVEREEAAAREAAVRERMQRRAEAERQKAEQEEAARETAQAAQAAEQERARRKFQAEIEHAEQEEVAAREVEQERMGRRAQAERQMAEQEEAARKAAEEEMARREEVQAEIECVEREEAAEQEHAVRRAQAERQRAEQEETARQAAEQERARKRAQVEREQAEAARLAAEQDVHGQYEDEAEENISRTPQWKRGWTPQRRQTRTPQSEQGRTPFHDTPGSDMRRRMAEWQREREAISREIELANSSQVIVINSDEDGRQRHDGDEDDVQGLEAQFDPRSDDNTPLDLGEAGEDDDSEDYSEEEGPQEQEEEGEGEEYEDEDEDEEVDDDDVVDIWQQEAQEQSQVSHHSSTRHAKDDAPSESASSPWKGSNAAPSESDNAYSPAHWTHDREKVPYLGGQSRVKQLREQEVDFSSLIRAENTPNHTRYYYGSSSPQSTVNGRSSQRARSNTQSPEKFANNAYGQIPLSDIGLESSPHKPSDDDAFQIDPTTRMERERLRFDRLPEEEEEEEEEEEDSDYSEAAAAAERSVDEKVDMTPQSSRNANPDIQGSTWYQRLVGLTPGWLRAPARKSPMQQRSPVSDADSEHVTDSELGEDANADADAGAYSNEEEPEQMESQDMEQAFRASRRFTEWRQQHEPQTSPDSRAGQPFSPPGNEARYESSPARPRPAPLSVSGYFTDDHYIVLRRLYRLAKRSPDRFPFYPAPGRGEIIGDWIWTSDGRHGVPVTEGQFAVIDWFVRELSTGDIQGGGTGQIGWTEADLHRRLISVIIGEQIRAERKASMRESEM